MIDAQENPGRLPPTECLMKHQSGLNHDRRWLQSERPSFLTHSIILILYYGRKLARRGLDVRCLEILDCNRVKFH